MDWPKDWRTPKLLYAVEFDRGGGDWAMMDSLTPFKDQALKRAAAAFDHRRSRLVTYRRLKVERKRSPHGWYSEVEVSWDKTRGE